MVMLAAAVVDSRTKIGRKRKTINARSHKNVCRQKLCKSIAYKVTHIRKSVSYSCVKFVFCFIKHLNEKSFDA